MNPMVYVLVAVTFAWCVYDIVKTLKDKIDKHK